jgi:hypothetical protein
MKTTYLFGFLDLLLGMLMMVLLMVNPEAKEKDSTDVPGNLFIYSTWVDQGDDVDLWLKAPDMNTPLGYSVKDSKNCNLVRDDLGTDNDPLKMNYENMYCRDTPDGEYIINLQAYRVFNLPITVNVQIGFNQGGKTVVLFNKQVELKYSGEELTVIRFTMENGAVVQGSIHSTPIVLRGT